MQLVSDDPVIMKDKVISDGAQSILMCKIPNQKLSDHVLSTTMANSQTACMKKCMGRLDCLSLNFYPDDGVCELNDALDIEFPGDFAPNIGTVHLTQRECI